MADKYDCFEELARNERAGVDFRFLLQSARPEFAIVAPHGGGIEPGTSEIAHGIAGEEYSFYAFEGIKSTGNTDLHITSTNFDEPFCLKLIRACEIVITIHGEHSEKGEGVFVGGRDKELGDRIIKALNAKGFAAARPTDPNLQGLEKRNICNRGQTRQGVQLELSQSVRLQLFESLTRKGRNNPTPRFDDFVGAVRSVLSRASK